MKTLHPTLSSQKKPIIINLSDLPDPVKPDWSKGNFLSGNKQNTIIELPLMVMMTWQHKHQRSSTISGNDILKGLVKGYDIKRIYDWAKSRTCCVVEKDDTINGHLGLKTLIWLKDNWFNLPPSQKDSLYGKTIYGLSDTMFDDVHGLSMPYVTFTTMEPVHGWYSLTKNLGRNDRFLVDSRSPYIMNLPVAEFIP